MNSQMRIELSIIRPEPDTPDRSETGFLRHRFGMSLCVGPARTTSNLKMRKYRNVREAARSTEHQRTNPNSLREHNFQPNEYFSWDSGDGTSSEPTVYDRISPSIRVPIFRVDSSASNREWANNFSTWLQQIFSMAMLSSTGGLSLQWTISSLKSQCETEER